MIKPLVWIALAVAALPQPGAAVAPPADAGTDWLEGEWQGSGTSFGRPSTATLNVRQALAGKFLELSYKVVTVTGPKSTAFEGRAFYKNTGAGKWQAWWFDDQGASLPISATLSDDQLTAEWGGRGTSRGRTVYRRLADGRLEVIDWSFQKDGSLREFARQEFAKAR